ncbi:hypothetical protein AAFF_G00269940 [Aldrovandia affinis]|uniref:Programmed cell death protein 2 C-terminal domain-containing protein n=1 Tax=Aldrovandia affinis TaxID=143900 RepID=A0AAD7SST8_9TELE|nr:hypothetical protein AAFF_G00269940 [Aldrovandia affinis]
MATVVESLLIGSCDAAIGKNVASFSTNKIGGLPDCLPSISMGYPSCALCSTVLTHVVQVYCPLAASSYHRTINVFACPNPMCYGKSESWKALRSQCLDNPVCDDQRTKCATVEEAPMATRDWCEEADDWGEADEEGPVQSADSAHSHEAPQTSPVSNLDFSSRMQGLSLVEGRESSPDVPGSVPTFCPYYISVLEEGDLLDHTDMEHAQRLLQEYEKREGVAVGQMDGCEREGQVEKYEKTEARHGDQTFSRFMKKISLCPEQILRYCWSGSPLFITDPPSNVSQMVPPCSHCGDPRTFEFQLMPALVSLLTSVDSSSEVAVEFGTVLVYTSPPLQPARVLGAEQKLGLFSRGRTPLSESLQTTREFIIHTKEQTVEVRAGNRTWLCPIQSPLLPYDWLKG